MRDREPCICWTDLEYPPLGLGVFFWGPPLYSWPIKLVRGHDEHHRSTVGVVTWLGSAFLAWPCKGYRQSA